MRFYRKYDLGQDRTDLFLDVAVILGGETDGLLSASVDTVETFSLSCGLFDSGIPPLPKPRRQAGAAYLDGK